MLQRSFIESFRKHDWVTSAIEFVLLVLGIYFAFQLDRWNSDRLEQKEADEYSIQLLTDLSNQLIEVEDNVVYYNQVRTFGAAALTAWNESPELSAEALIIAFYQASNILALSSKRGAYDALSAKGLVDLVGDPDFGSDLSNYYAQALNFILDQQTPYRMEIRGVIPNQVQQAIRKNCARLRAGGRVVETLLDSCAIGLSDNQARNVLASIINYPKMQIYLRQNISRVSVNIYIMEVQIEIIKQLREKLKKVQTNRAVT